MIGDLASVEAADAAAFAGTIGPVPIDIDAVFQRQLSRGEDPDTIIDNLNAAIRRGRLRLFRDGQGVESDWFNEHLRVIFKRENGRPVAQMVELRAVEGNWAVSDIPQPTAQHNPSRSRNPLGSRKRVPRSWIKVRRIAAEEWPNGYDDIEHRHLVKIIGDKTGSKRDVILRALGLRK